MVIESRLRPDGIRRQRIQCCSCRDRWTLRVTDQPALPTQPEPAVPTSATPRHTCCKCHGRGAVIESRLCINGSRRQRIQCGYCGYRWTAWLGEKPLPGSQGPRVRLGRPEPARRLSDAEVREILLDRTRSLSQLARAFDRTPEAIRKIQIGRAYATVLPELPRRGARSQASITCFDCEHWRSRCLMGLPDPELEGVGFAEDCSVFLARSDVSQASADRSPAAVAH